MSPAPSLLSGWHPFAEADAWAASDAIPVTEFGGDWASGFSPRAGSNVMLLPTRAEIGAENGQWRLGWEYRQNATIVTTRNTVELVRLYKQRLAPQGAASHVLDVQFDAWSAQGPRLARWFGPAGSGGWVPRVQLAAAFYSSAALRETQVAGTVDYNAAGQYGLHVRRVEAHSGASYPFMRETPGVSGASLSLAIAWRPANTVSLEVKVDDLWSRLQRRNVPLTEERIDSAVTQYDQQGYVDYRPLLNGTHRQVSGNRALPRSGAASASYALGALSVTAGIERIAGVTIPTLSLRRQFGWGKLSTSVETRFRTIGIGVDTQRFHLALQTDRLRLGQAKSLGLSVGVRY